MSQVATRVPLFTTWDDDDPFIVLTETKFICSRPQYLETFRAGSDLSHLGLAPPREEK